MPDSFLLADQELRRAEQLKEARLQLVRVRRFFTLLRSFAFAVWVMAGVLAMQNRYVAAVLAGLIASTAGAVGVAGWWLLDD